MTAPLPYPIGGSGATSIYSADLTAWLSNPDWVRTGDAVIVDAWAGTNTIVAQTQQLFYWDNNPGSPQSPTDRSTAATFVIPGLPPSSFVTVSVGTKWRLGPPTGFVGMRVAGSPFAPGAGPTGTLTAPTVAMVGYGTTDGTGNLTVAFAVEGVHPSFNLNIEFLSLDVYLGFSDPDPFRDIIVNTAAVYEQGNRPVSITRQGARFDPGWILEEWKYPGKRAATLAGHEVVGMAPVVRTVMLLTGERHWLVYAPGGAWSDGPYGRRYTPPAMGAALAAGVYLTDVRVIWERLRGDFIQVHMPFALVRSHAIESTDLTEGGIAVEIAAVQDITGATPTTARLYYVDILPAGYTL